ncbi:MAG TPA: biotin synthase BioB, partial [Paraprevotella xylaniphila]|nr:biotin synthase BioB [Paraprevotella xylaniphila]
MIEELEKKVHEGQALTPEEVIRTVEKAPLDAL